MRTQAKAESPVHSRRGAPNEVRRWRGSLANPPPEPPGRVPRWIISLLFLVGIVAAAIVWMRQEEAVFTPPPAGPQGPATLTPLAG